MSLLLPNHESHMNTILELQRRYSETSPIIAKIFIHPPIHITPSSVKNTTIHINTLNEEIRLVSVCKRPNTPLSVEDINLLLDTLCKAIIAGD